LAKVELIALDVAVLPPPEVSALAIELSARLGTRPGPTLRLDERHLPHITLTQQFVRTDQQRQVLDTVAGVLDACPPLMLRVTGGGGDRTVWMAIERTPPLADLHRRLMDALQPWEVEAGDASAFADGKARVGDLRWVSGFRAHSSFARFTPHITLGHADDAPAVTPLTFDATRIAACHLGRFCTCRRVLAEWTLESRPREGQRGSGASGSGRPER